MNEFKKQIFDEDEIKERLRKSKPHLIILYEQMERLDKIANNSDKLDEQIEITNTMMKIVEVISISLNCVDFDENHIKNEIIKNISLIQKTIFQDWLKDLDDITLA